MPIYAKASDNGANSGGGPVDWAVVRKQILARLDIGKEFEALGVKFTKASYSAKGWRECHAIDRPDDIPSAAVNILTGIYKDQGGEGLTTNLFDFALRFGSFGQWSDVFRHYADKASVELGRVERSSHGKILEHVYHYRDESGSTRYGVFRYRLPNGKKDFRQCPWVNDQWHKAEGCMDGVVPLPYRLPDILANPDAPIWICEGEKDCDRAAELGLVATTNHQGAASTDKTWPKFLEHFRGRTCFVLPDNDTNGTLHAGRVAAYLAPTAALVKIVPLPGVPLKGDLSDWLDAGGDVEDLRGLADAAPAWEAGDAHEAPDENTPPPPKRYATVASLRNFLNDTPWLWPHWIPNSCLTLLAAVAGTGKTRFMFDLHRRAYHGFPWPDGSPMTLPPGGKVVWVVADDQYQEMCDITHEFGLPDDAVVLATLEDDPFGGTSLQTTSETDAFGACVEAIKPYWAVIDTITNTSDFKSQDTSDAKRQYKPLQQIASRLQTSIVCVTHTNAVGTPIGRRPVEKVRVVVQIECPNPANSANLKVWVSKSKAVKPPALGATMTDHGNDYSTEVPEKPAGETDGRKNKPVPPKVGTCMEWLKARLHGVPDRVKSTRDAAEVDGYDARTLYRAKEELNIEEYELEGKKWWRLPNEGEAF